MNTASELYYTDPSQTMGIENVPIVNQAEDDGMTNLHQEVDDIRMMESDTNQENEPMMLASFKTPDPRQKVSSFRDVLATHIADQVNRTSTVRTPNDDTSLSTNNDDMTGKDVPSETSPSSAVTKSSNPEDYDAIVRQTQIALNEKLENNKIWAQKLLNAVAEYSKALSGVHTEYTNTQRQEHQEAQRLDKVEPDVHGLTRYVLDKDVGPPMDDYRSFQNGRRESSHGGVKRRLHQG